MKFLLLLICSWAIVTYLLKKKKNVIKDIDNEQGIGQQELKELMELSRKSKQQPTDFENLVIGKFQIFLRDFSYENYLSYGHDMYVDSFYKRLTDIFQFMAVNSITGFPNRDAEIHKTIDWVFNETGFAMIDTPKDEAFNVFHIGNLNVSVYLPDPRLNKIMGFHKPQVPVHDWITVSDIVKDFLIPHPIKAFNE